MTPSQSGSLMDRLKAGYAPYGLQSVLKKTLRSSSSVLEIGCGTGSALKHMKARHMIIGLDCYEPAIQEHFSAVGYNSYVVADMRSMPFPDRAFDAVVCLDVIEHVPREEGFELLRKMEVLARKTVVVYTPNGFVEQAASVNPWQRHVSGWTIDDFKSRGYATYGIYGHKGLRGPYARLNRKPFVFWEVISRLSHFYTKVKPSSAYALCAVKVL